MSNKASQAITLQSKLARMAFRTLAIVGPAPFKSLICSTLQMREGCCLALAYVLIMFLLMDPSVSSLLWKSLMNLTVICCFEAVV